MRALVLILMVATGCTTSYPSQLTLSVSEELANWQGGRAVKALIDGASWWKAAGVDATFADPGYGMPVDGFTDAEWDTRWGKQPDGSAEIVACESASGIDVKLSVIAGLSDEDLRTVFAHEMGHALGLDHDTVHQDAVMWPYLRTHVALSPWDIRALKSEGN